MVSIRFQGLVLWFFLIMFLIVIRDSTADPQAPSAFHFGVGTTEGNEGIMDGVPVAATTFRKQRFGGRKMGASNVMIRKKILKEEQLNGDCQHQPISADCKLSARNLLPVKDNVGGFVAFSADYHVPKPHPPKNN